MATVLVNSRVDEQLKKSAEKVFAEHRTTSSEVIRRLFEQIVLNQSIPEYLDDDEPTAEEIAEKLARLRDLAGILKSPRLATDEGTAQVMEEEMMRRYGR